MVFALAVALAMSEASMPQLPPPNAYLRASDREKARRMKRDEWPCTRKRHQNGFDFIESLPTDQCFKMTQPQRMHGIWIDEFEGSSFYPNVTQAPSQKKQRYEIWLNTQRVSLTNGYRRGRRNGRAVLIEFVGRRTLYPGPSGHMGLWKYEVIIDRVISARELPDR